MKAKTKFIKWFNRYPEESRKDLVWNPYGKNPMSMNVLFIEIKYDTGLGKKLLRDMGWKDG